MNIEITPKNTTGVERSVTISVPAETIAAAEESTARRYASHAKLPGFRPGKAPANMVKKKYADAIRQEVLESVVRDAYKEVVEKQNLKIASQPHVHGLNFEEGKPLTFELHFEVRPEVVLSRTEGFKITKRAGVVTDTQLNEQIDHLRGEKATWNPVEGRAEPGDMVRVKLGVANEQGVIAEEREVPFVLGEGTAIASIEDLIMEAKIGETLERPVRWPDDFPDEAQRGQTKMVRVTLHEVKRKALPELDDAFAREVGDFDSVESLRSAVRTDMERYAEREVEAEVKNSLIDNIISANPFDIPKSWVKQLVDNYLQAYQVTGDHQEQFSSEFMPIAERQIRRDLIIDTIAERENLAATEKDIDDRITEQAEKRNLKPSEVYASLEKAGRIKEIERSITEDKVFEWLISRNDIVQEPAK